MITTSICSVIYLSFFSSAPRKRCLSDSHEDQRLPRSVMRAHASRFEALSSRVPTLLYDDIDPMPGIIHIPFPIPHLPDVFWLRAASRIPGTNDQLMRART